MQKTALVIMAAGIGSRFGKGIKQLAPVGTCGEIIMDYSIHDALEAGFNKVVFIIRKDLEEEFRRVIGERIEKITEVEYVFQELDDLPDGRNGSHLVQILRCRLFHFYIFLCSQKNLLSFLLHGLLDRLDGPLPADVKMGHHLRHHSHTPEGYHGKASYFSLSHFICSCPVFSQFFKRGGRIILAPAPLMLC